MIFLSNKSIFAKLYFFYRTWKDHDIIIVNGYNNYTFPIKIMSFYNNNYYCKKIWKNKSMDKSFWNTKCYSTVYDKF